MTGERTKEGRFGVKRAKKEAICLPILKKFAFGYMSIFLMLLFFVRSSEAFEWVGRGLELCAKRLIPSLFPFMVASSLIISSGIGSTVGSIAARPAKKLFGVGGQGTAALLLGWLCGFPIGAKSAQRLFSEGKISYTEFERIVCISGVPSPAFLIGVVGTALLGDSAKGVAIYVICLLSSALVGVGINLLGAKEPAPVSSYGSEDKGQAKLSFARAFSGAVLDSVKSMLLVSGLVVFFSAFVGTLEALLSESGLQSPVNELIFGFFEMTMGISRMSLVPLPENAVFLLCTAISAWSGLSVHLQVIGFCEGGKFPMAKYFLASLCKVLIAQLLAILWLWLFL